MGWPFVIWVFQQKTVRADSTKAVYAMLNGLKERSNSYKNIMLHEMDKFNFTVGNSPSTCKTIQTSKLKKSAIELLDDIEKSSGKTLCLPNLDSKQRFKLKTKLCDSCFTVSKGRGIERCMFVWKKSDVINTLQEFLPSDIICAIIIPKLCDLVNINILENRQKKIEKILNVQSIDDYLHRMRM